LFKSDLDQVAQRVGEGLHHREHTLLKRRLLTEIQHMSKLVDEIATGSPMSTDERFIRNGGLTLDVQRRSAMLDGHKLDLTTAEFDLLAKLVSAAPSPVSVAGLVASLGYQFAGAAENVGQWHIHNLRKKVGHKRIKTLRGQGYVWVG
jgi:two-component system response regulator BasR